MKTSDVDLSETGQASVSDREDGWAGELSDDIINSDAEDMFKVRALPKEIRS